MQEKSIKPIENQPLSSSQTSYAPMPNIASDTPTLRLFSWNLNGIRAVHKKQLLADFFTTHAPDIVCFQEIKARPEQFTAELKKLPLAALANYHQYWHPATRPGYSGTAIFTRIKPLAVINDYPSDLLAKYGPLSDQFGDPLTEGRLQILEFTDFYLVNVYTPNSKPDLSRLTLREKHWDPLFAALLSRLEQQKPVLACGDFNAAHTDIDLARPKQNQNSAGFTPAERQGITNLLTAGFIDTFRHFHPADIRYTWWSHYASARAKNIGWRIDYFFASRSLLSRLTHADIHESTLGSDHCPVSVCLSLITPPHNLQT